MTSGQNRRRGCLLSLHPVINDTFMRFLQSLLVHWRPHHVPHLGAGGLSRAAVEWVVIKLEGQVELILSPHGTSLQHFNCSQEPICFGSIGLFWKCSFPSFLSVHRLSVAPWCVPKWTCAASDLRSGHSGHTWRKQGRPLRDCLNWARLLHEISFSHLDWSPLIIN